ncbi:MAG: hypothetical protein AAFQ94_26545 [Bacteroidota bacterium]
MIAHIFQLLWLISGFSSLVQEPAFNTYSVKFDGYIHSENWNSIPISSARKSQRDIKVLSTESKNEIENAVALNSLKITADLINDSEVKYKVESIHLNIEKVHSLKDISYAKGNRDLGKGQNYFHVSQFNITTDTLSYIEIPEGLILYPSDLIVYDSRIYCEVKAREANILEKAVIEFKLSINLSEIGNPRQQLMMNSDRNYFIAVL